MYRKTGKSRSVQRQPSSFQNSKPKEQPRAAWEETQRRGNRRPHPQVHKLATRPCSQETRKEDTVCSCMPHTKRFRLDTLAYQYKPVIKKPLQATGPETASASSLGCTPEIVCLQSEKDVCTPLQTSLLN